MAQRQVSTICGKIPAKRFEEPISFRERLATFNGWTSPVDRVELASCGMVWLHVRDLVRCTYCLQVQSDWRTDETVITQHYQNQEDCPLVKRFTSSASTFYFAKSPGPVARILALKSQARLARQARRQLKKSK